MRYRELKGHLPFIGAKKDLVANESGEVVERSDSGTKPVASQSITPA